MGERRRLCAIKHNRLHFILFYPPQSNSIPLHQSVVLIREDRNAPKLPGLLRRHVRIGNNDNNVAHLHPTRSSPIQANDPAAPLSANGIGLETLAVVVVHDLDLFPLHNIGGFQQILIDRDATDIIQVGLRDAHAVYLAFENFDEHAFLFLATENNQSPDSVAKVDAPDEDKAESLG